MRYGYTSVGKRLHMLRDFGEYPPGEPVSPPTMRDGKSLTWCGLRDAVIAAQDEDAEPVLLGRIFNSCDSCRRAYEKR